MRQISPETLYDKRLIERHIRQGLLTRAEVERHFEALEDATQWLASPDDEVAAAPAAEPEQPTQEPPQAEVDDSTLLTP